MPFGAAEKRDSASVYGFRLENSSLVNSTVIKKPILDLRFTEQGYHSLPLRSVVLHQNQMTTAEAQPKTNWWVLGAIVGGAATIAIYEANKKDSPPPPAAKKGGGF